LSILRTAKPDERLAGAHVAGEKAGPPTIVIPEAAPTAGWNPYPRPNRNCADRGYGFRARGLDYLFEHDLDRKPVPTFRDHALKRPAPRNDGVLAMRFFCSPPAVTSARAAAVLF
jgi:hypothetical protein